MQHLTVGKILTSWRLDSIAVWADAAALCCVFAYGLAARRLSPRGRSWYRGRSLSFVAGVGLLVFVCNSGLQTYEDNPAVHVIGHMLVMMAVPPLLAFGAPITLLLRTLPIGARRMLVRQLKDPAFRPLWERGAAPLLAADYYLTMFIYQLTPLHDLAERHSLVHFGVHQYMLLCGVMFWLPVACVDPVRFRPSPRTKLVMIGCGLPMFGLLGAIEIANGDGATGWAYITCGAILTTAALAGVRAGSRSVSRRGRTVGVAPTFDERELHCRPRRLAGRSRDVPARGCRRGSKSAGAACSPQELLHE